jgi:cobyrinic acid a,c-diamide synthase
MAKTGLIIAGLSSASGKTFTTLGLLRALRNCGASVAAAKTGPDYIDPGFHEAALGRPSVNLDGYAMERDLIRHLAVHQDGDTLIIEGVMGLYDGGEGSSLNLAKILDLPVVLVMDIRGQSETAGEVAAALKERLTAEGIPLAGIILNRLQSERHGTITAEHCQNLGLAVFGAIPELPGLHMPSRHLGLVQATDLAAGGGLEDVLEKGAEVMTAHCDLEAVVASAAPINPNVHANEALALPGQKIAVARDAAFGFSYSHIIKGWQRMGAEVDFFSPVADEVPQDGADFIFLPGGYPELHLEALSAASAFKSAMVSAAKGGTRIYGECGGYMTLGRSIISKDGKTHPMLGLLDLVTSFDTPHRVLGYREVERITDFPLPKIARGHEFHYTKAVAEEGTPLFTARTMQNSDLGQIGLVAGNVAGSYAHLIAAVY